MQPNSWWLRRIAQGLAARRTAESGRMWAIFALVLPVLLTGALGLLVKSVESRLSTRLEETKTSLQADLEATKAALQRGSAFSQAREEAYIQLWAQASTIPSQIRQASRDASQISMVAEALDKLNVSYRERSLYLTPEVEEIIDRISHNGFRVFRGHVTIVEMDADVNALRTAMQKDLQFQELAKIAIVPATKPRAPRSPR